MLLVPNTRLDVTPRGLPVVSENTRAPLAAKASATKRWLPGARFAITPEPKVQAKVAPKTPTLDASNTCTETVDTLFCAQSEEPLDPNSHRTLAAAKAGSN